MSSQAEAIVVPESVVIGDLGHVARVGVGTAGLAGDIEWGISPHKQLSINAIAHGLTGRRSLIDTSPCYGPDLAEQYVAEALARSSHEVLVATKAGMSRSPGGAWVHAGSPRAIRASVERSLINMNAEALDLVQLHAEDPAVPLEESLGQLFAMRDEGLVREIGVCNLNRSQVERAIAVGPIVSVQVRLSVDNTHGLLANDLRFYELSGLAVIAATPFGKILHSDKLSAAPQKLSRGSQAQLALRLLLQASPALIAVPGSADVAHIRSNQQAPSLQLNSGEVLTLLQDSGADEKVFAPEWAQLQPKLPVRLGNSPRTTLDVPQQQVTQNAPLDLRKELLSRILLLPGIEVKDTVLAIPGAVAFHVADETHARSDAFMAAREFLHLHPPHDGSFHAIFSSADVEIITTSGWGIHHLLTGYVVHQNTLMIWGPRDTFELEVCWKIVQMSHSHATGWV